MTVKYQPFGDLIVTY